jgi:hypothetical protein
MGAIPMLFFVLPVALLLVVLILIGCFVVKKTKQTLADLMMITGLLLVLGSVPIGILFVLEIYYGFHFDLHWSIIGALAMTISTAIVGGVFLCLGRYIYKERCKTIFIALLDEGVDVWRPVKALHVRDDVYQIRSKPPEGEHWQFSFAELVRCDEKTFADGRKGLVGQQKVSV